MSIKRYRKKPVEIEAMALSRNNIQEVAKWCGGRVVSEANPADRTDVYLALDIPTLEGVMRAETTHWSTWNGSEYTHGDWIIRGVQGEFYPCKPDIFEATYEEVPDAVS